MKYFVSPGSPKIKKMIPNFSDDDDGEKYKDEKKLYPQLRFCAEIDVIAGPTASCNCCYDFPKRRCLAGKVGILRRYCDQAMKNL